MTARSLPDPRLSWPAYRHRVHEQALRLGTPDWTILLGLADLCMTLRRHTPRWALELLEHVEDLGIEAPEGIEEVLAAHLTDQIARRPPPHLYTWGLRVGLWQPRQPQPTPLDITPLGRTLARFLRSPLPAAQAPAPVPPADDEKVGRWELLAPFAPLDPDPPLVTEDGTAGRVLFKCETETGGPAWLVRGKRSEPLFGGRWVDMEVAQAYAREHGHTFSAQ